MAKQTKKLEWTAIERRVAQAAQDAEDLIVRLNVRATPVDPVAIAHTEGKLLRLCPGNYKNAFDGRLEYLRERQRFLCYYNTKYDHANGGEHAPRTRFSLSHELGHFFIESHHEYLRSGGRCHSSKSEFLIATPVERQADAFAARLLMPDRLICPLVNQEELSVGMIADLARTFRTSFVATAMRTVECTHFYCAVAAIRDGGVAWMRRSAPLVERGVYPGELGPVQSAGARAAWNAFQDGASVIAERPGWARDWFRIYDDDLRARLPVIEQYLPARILKTLLVVITVPEDELLQDDEAD